MDTLEDFDEEDRLREEYLDWFSELEYNVDLTDESQPLSEYFVRAEQLRAVIDNIIDLFGTKLHSKDELEYFIFTLVVLDKVELLRCIIDGQRISGDLASESDYLHILNQIHGSGVDWITGELVIWLTDDILPEQIEILTPADKRLEKTINMLQDDLSKMKEKLQQLRTAALDCLNRGLKLRLDHGIDLSIRDSGGMTLLHYTGVQEILDLIFKDGDDINPRNDEGQTPLHTFMLHILGGCTSAQLDFIGVLIEKGADIDATDELGLTPLHIATSERQSVIVRKLLLMGADINIESKEGKTAFDMIQPGDYHSCRYHAANRMKLEAAGFYVSKKNLDHNLISDWNVPYNSGLRKIYENLCKFELCCAYEVQDLKSHKFAPCMSLFDILHTNDPRYVINRTLMGISSKLNRFHLDYPIYQEWLTLKIEHDEKLFELLEPATKALRVVYRTSSVLNKQAMPNLLDELELKIVCYLKVRDIRNLITCAQEIEKQIDRNHEKESHATVEA